MLERLFYLQHWDKSDIPKIRKYSTIETKQIKLLKCVENIIEKHAGGYDAPNVASSILKSAFDNESLSTSINKIDTVTSECKNKLADLYTYKKRDIDQAEYTK